MVGTSRSNWSLDAGHNCRRRLRRVCWWFGHFYVMPLSRSHIAALVVLGLILGTFVQSALDMPYRPRFANSALNFWAVAIAALLVPILTGWVARSFSPAWPRRVGLALAVLLSLPCLLVSSCAALEAPAFAEADTGYELLSEARAGAVIYRLYRTNCGATCAFGLDLREEREFLGGIKLVSPLWSLYRASEGQLHVGQSAVRVINGGVVLAEVKR